MNVKTLERNTINIREVEMSPSRNKENISKPVQRCVKRVVAVTKRVIAHKNMSDLLTYKLVERNDATENDTANLLCNNAA